MTTNQNNSATTTTTTAAAAVQMHSGVLTAHACRLLPGADFVASLQAAAVMACRRGCRTTNNRTSSLLSSLSSGVVVLTCVGSLASLTLRMANAAAAAVTTHSIDATTGTDCTDNNDKSSDGVSCFRSWNEPLEIVSLVGTFAVTATTAAADTTTATAAAAYCAGEDGLECKFHLHLAVSDASGRVFGGHLVSSTVHTTVELVLGSLEPSVHFDRVHDLATGYRELVVSSSSSSPRATAENQQTTGETE